MDGQVLGNAEQESTSLDRYFNAFEQSLETESKVYHPETASEKQCMIEDVTGFISQLVNLFPAAQDDQRALCKLEVAVFPNTQDLALLNDIAHGDDQILSGEIKREMENRGQVFTDWVAEGNSKFSAGDDNAFGVKAKGHTFARVAVSGYEEVHLGNVNRGVNRDTGYRLGRRDTFR